MQHVPNLLLVVSVACTRASTVHALPSSPASQASDPTRGTDLTRERSLIRESDAARQASDYATARAKLADVVTSLVARPAAEEDAAWLALLDGASQAAWDLRDPRTANRGWTRVLAVRSRTLSVDDLDLQVSRGKLGLTLAELGDLHGARDVFSQVLEVLSRTLADDHVHLQSARANLALTLKDLGDLDGARALEAQVLEVRSRTLPEDHPDLQAARGNLAVTLYKLQDLAPARALLEQLLEVRSRTLREDDPVLQGTRGNLALVLKALGDLAGARALETKVLDVNSRTLPDDHPELQAARLNLAVTLQSLGDLAVARTLQERVLQILSRALPDDHPYLQAARGDLATTLGALGDLAGARALEEKVLEVNSRTLPDDHPSLQAARANLALTIQSVGDFAGARALEEKVLEVRARTLPDDHPEVHVARLNLAGTMYQLGDFSGARDLLEETLEALARTLPDEHPNLQTARGSLAVTLQALGDLAGAQALLERVLEVDARTLPDEHRDLQRARESVAESIARVCARASSATESGNEDADPFREPRQRCAALIGTLCRAQVRAARDAILGSPAREAEERCWFLAQHLNTALSFASGYGVFEPLRTLEAESFVLSETTRGAALVSAELTRKAASAPKYGELRDALRAASEELARVARQGATSQEFDRARVRREWIEREIAALARELSGGTARGVDLDADSLAAMLADGEAAVGFRRFSKRRVDVVDELDSSGRPAVRATSVDSLCAFVVRGSTVRAQPDVAPISSLTVVDLGSFAPIESAVRAWRAALGVASGSRGRFAATTEAAGPDSRTQGTRLREQIFDPLLPTLVGVEHLVLVPDDVLSLVPFDALPLDESMLLGDRWRIETRTTLTELFKTRGNWEDAGEFVAIGDVEYGDGVIPDEAGSATQLVAADVDSSAPTVAGVLRGSAWSGGFSALDATGVEVRGIARCFADAFGAGVSPKLCERADATREQLVTLAPKARWLHIATHGWFAPESIPTWSDPEPLDMHTKLGARSSGVEQVKGMSPMLLCGLALAGANSPETATGSMPGLVTADELSTLDLANCELVVLSACDTNVGECRAGQGVASLQRALQMAGARSVITSLWKVPDEATKELMLEFYRRLWVAKRPKWQALWEAKSKLREARDDDGALKYTTRDWAAWVLTGEPL